MKKTIQNEKTKQTKKAKIFFNQTFGKNDSTILTFILCYNFQQHRDRTAGTSVHIFHGKLYKLHDKLASQQVTVVAETAVEGP